MTAEESKLYRQNFPEKAAVVQRKYYTKNRELILAKAKARHIRLKINTMEKYGGAYCACCGEDHFEFLSIDHINGGGSKHRRELKSSGKSYNMYQWLRANNYPEGFRVLCMNCNCAMGLYGYCPHSNGEDVKSLEVTAYDDQF